MRDEISNTDDTINVNDVKDRIDELESDLIGEEGNEDYDDERDELAKLKVLWENCSGYEDETLIRDSYFKEYAQQLAEDIGAIPNDVQWPCNCIDWEEAACQLQMDYTHIDFNGATYLVRG